MSFIDELISRGVVTEKEAGAAVSRAESAFAGDLDAALIELGIAEDKVISLKSSYFSIPVKQVDPQTVTTDMLKYIPEDSARHYRVVPVGMTNGTLEIGVVDPENTAAMDAIDFIANKMNVPFRIYLIQHSLYATILERYKGMTGEVDKALSEIDEEIASAGGELLVEDKNPQNKLSLSEEEHITEDAPIIKIVAVIINHATEGNASDIHIENTGEKVKVRFRVDGVLHTSLLLPINVYSGIVARIKILSKLRLDEKRKPQDGSFSARVAGRKVDFRVSTFPTSFGEKVVIRILDSQKGVKSLDDMAFSPQNRALVDAALKKPYGIILVTGPTGSGKSTTLYSMLNALDREGMNIISLEDPVEYNIPNMNQSQVMPEIGYTFASGLRSVLRQDPDVIMVGEIRDKETAQLAIQAALTGHLVLSTLHTNNAIGVIPRLVDMGIDPYLIAPTLILSIAQRLVRVACPSALKQIPTDESTKAMIEKQFTDLPEEFRKNMPAIDTSYEIVESADCPGGTRGRIAVFEMFPVDKEMQSTILRTPTEDAIYKVARKKGMFSMKEDAIAKALKGETPMTEVFGFN